MSEDVTLIELLHTLRQAITGDDGEPVDVLGDPLYEDRDGEIYYRGHRYDLIPIVSAETMAALDRYIHALEIQGDKGVG